MQSDAFMETHAVAPSSKRGKAACATTLGKDDTMTSWPRTFLITGASKGIGLALSVRLAGAGHRVVGLARGADPEFPGELVSVDLGDRAATTAVLDEVAARHRLGGVVNNVGLVRPSR